MDYTIDGSDWSLGDWTLPAPVEVAQPARPSSLESATDAPVTVAPVYGSILARLSK